jgi:antitoxin (DNA-binding transcriptional repressor) of toxin-antitoxin stability system
VRDHTIATIRELRTDFRSVKRRIEQHGQLVITDRGEPAYLLQALPRPRSKKTTRMPNYYRRLRKRQPIPLTAEQTRQFWDEERR